MHVALWLLVHWKWAVPLAAIAVVAIAVTVPAAGRFVLVHRAAFAAGLALFVLCGVVAGSTYEWVASAQRAAELQRQRDEALLKLTVLEADQAAAQKQRSDELEWADHAKGLKDALTDPRRICFDEPDADRVRQLFD